MNSKLSFNNVKYYFFSEWKLLLIVTITGLIYNIGLLVTPYYEGAMTQCLIDILQNNKTYIDMFNVVIYFLALTLIVQFCRYLKRLYVRKFANNINKKMKNIIFSNLALKNRQELFQQNIGDIMIKAISDADDCSEGMRKFTTELFDTGVALIAYVCMLLYYDYKLTLLCIIFPFITYYIAEKMKVVVQKENVLYKKQVAILNSETIDRVDNAIIYRVYGYQDDREKDYEIHLKNYEKSSIRANMLIAAIPPVYKTISMISIIFILYFGYLNITCKGSTVWTIATFTTFLSCYTKLANKTSSGAKLFNSVHKAHVSWNRIKPLLNKVNIIENKQGIIVKKLQVNNLSFKYPESNLIFMDLSFQATQGQIIGVSGPVACGKSTFGKVFLNEYPYIGCIRLDDRELNTLSREEIGNTITYLGHDCELFKDSIKNNILLGKDDDINKYLKLVDIYDEVMNMDDGVDTIIGREGITLSGGQAQRIAIARTLAHRKSIIIMDDPFSALDKETEKIVFNNIKDICKDNIIIFISHRLYLFKDMDNIIWFDNDKTCIGTHEELLNTNMLYKELYEQQSVDIKKVNYEK